MPPLATALRRDLERTIIDSRKTAEHGARSALGALTVPDPKAGGHLDAAGRDLRNCLRAHARQLGDKRSAKGEQAIDRLVRECAYEHWHRMLFARFLAENDLLIEPVSGVSVSLDEVEELAREQKVNRWELASRYAQRMLPEIFRPDDPVLAVVLPTEIRLELESLLESLRPAVFRAEDSLGWVYQFWQSAEKDAVNDRVKSGEKITGETLPAVTQLFTEHYMVLFLLHNTIGAWHAGKILTSRDREEAGSEHALRDAVRLSPLEGYDFEYLRFVREPKDGEEPDEGTGSWRPAAGTYDGWPKSAAELRVLDPCCGSGHFLVAAFDLLVRLRIAEEGLSADDAIRAVLADNLFGLELDPRCTQIAAFNLALAAWKLAGKPIDLPPLHIACSGTGPQATKEEWLKLADDASEAWKDIPDHARHTIRNGLIDLHETFSKAPELGSLIDPTDRSSDLITADYETLKPFLDAVFRAETGDDEQRERAVAAKGMTDAAEILVGPDHGYTLVITNVPYLGRGNHNPILKSFCDARYPHSKQDLATVMLERCERMLGSHGSVAVVIPQNWLFLARYKRMRERILRNLVIHLNARLGPEAFAAIGGHVVNVALMAMANVKPSADTTFFGLDAQSADGPVGKERHLRDGPDLRQTSQLGQLKNPDAIITVELRDHGNLLSERARAWQGIVTSDDNRFVSCYWETSWPDDLWAPIQQAPKESLPYTGRSTLVRWEDEQGELHNGSKAHNFPPRATVGKSGVAIQRMSGLNATLYDGVVFDDSVAPIIPDDPADLPAIWTFCNSAEYHEAVRHLNQQVKVVPGTLTSVAFDRDHWSEQALNTLPNGLPEPLSHDPAQWLFHGHPAHAEAHAELQVGVARLLNYRWPAELDSEMRLADKARVLVERCAELHAFADEDGIVCLSPVRGEGSAADRLRRLLAGAFGDAWSSSKEHELLQAAADEFNKGTAAGSLDDWLRDRFFVEHCALFQHRPFIWHIWDGKKDGFHALVNYHNLAGPEGEGRRTLEALTYSYLGDWIQRQQDAVKSGEPGAESRLAAAMDLREQLEKILAAEPPYDIFVRWKPLHEQPIGWEPDINDGVRLNIRPLMSANLSKGRKGAGVLRWKPNIKWAKDRGKEPQSIRPREDFPWFWGWDERRQDFAGAAKYDGNRWNDLHYTNAFKQAARERAAEEVAT